MINILLEGYDIDEGWLYDELKKYIRPTHSVAVVAFSFRDNRVKSAGDWDLLYSKKKRQILCRYCRWVCILRDTGKKHFIRSLLRRYQKICRGENRKSGYRLLSRRAAG